MCKNISLVIIISILFVNINLFAGVVNPDISVIGQLNYGFTNDAGNVDNQKGTMTLGETELVFDSNLNPYSRGTFVFAVGDEGLEVEEAYLSIFNGLPRGLAIKSGKYRLGFGKLNPAHPHTYPFVEMPRVISQFLPGEDGFNEVATQLSYLLPTNGTWASNLSFDLLQGSSFHPDEPGSAFAYLERWNNSFLIKDVTPFDIGISAAQGTNNIQWKTKTNVYGFDAKTKIPVSVQGKLTLQGEIFANNNDIVIDTVTGTTSNLQRNGFYVSADYKVNTRTNFGLIYDQYQQQSDASLVDRALKWFIGFSLLEESTLFRLTYEQFMSANFAVVNTVGLQVLFSMGPHKAHQF